MTKTLLEKMYAKPNYSTSIVHAPEELKSSLFINNNTTDGLTGSYNFILAFYVKKKELEKEISQLRNSLIENGLVWIAYPKNKLLQTDLNRDILHSLMEKYNLDGVSLVSLTDTWSAMRFKQK